MDWSLATPTTKVRCPWRTGRMLCSMANPSSCSGVEVLFRRRTVPPDLEERLDALQPVPPLVSERPPGGDDPVQRIQRRASLLDASGEQRGERVEGPLLVEGHQEELLLQDPLERGERRTIVGWTRLAEGHQHREATLVEAALGEPDVDQRSRDGL